MFQGFEENDLVYGKGSFIPEAISQSQLQRKTCKQYLCGWVESMRHCK